MSGDLIRRVWEHKNDMIDGFTMKYHVHDLVYFEQHALPQAAAYREKQIKAWKREWKIELIEKMNPEWKDLYNDICC
jgi:putative endonuclease